MLVKDEVMQILNITEEEYENHLKRGMLVPTLISKEKGYLFDEDTIRVTKEDRLLEDKFLSLGDAAKKVNMKLGRLSGYTSRGTLRTYCIGKHIYVKEKDLMDFYKFYINPD